MKDIINIELFKVFRRPAFYVLSLLVILQSVFSVYKGPLMGLNVDVTAFSSINIALSQIGLFVAIIVIMIITNDRSEGTEKNIIGSGIDRKSIYFGKMIASVIVSLIFFGILLVTSFVSGLVLGGIGEFDPILFGYIGVSMVEAVILTIVVTFIGTVVPSTNFATSLSVIVVAGLPMATAFMAMSGNSILQNIAKFEMTSIEDSILTKGFYGETILHTVVLLALVLGIAFAGVFISAKKDVR